jgi:hypothetical protein
MQAHTHLYKSKHIYTSSFTLIQVHAYQNQPHTRPNKSRSRPYKPTHTHTTPIHTHTSPYKLPPTFPRSFMSQHVSVHLAGRDETPPAYVAPERLLSRMRSHMHPQVRRCAKRLLANRAFQFGERGGSSSLGETAQVLDGK